MTAPFLVADIGATNARFALADGQALVSSVSILATAEYPDAQTLLAAARERLGFDTLQGCCIAMAGPVHAGRGVMTNAALELDAGNLSRRLGCPSFVVNDFFALARALPELTNLQQIGGREPARGVQAVLGPGSGLGMSVLLPPAVGTGARLVLPSEGGHADLAPGSPLELEVLQVLSNELAHVSWESVLSGPGLLNLYRAVCVIWGVEPEGISAEWITARGVNADEPICHQVLELFFSFLGAAAGNLAVTVCAEGGIYIGGGIVPAIVRANRGFAAASPLRRRFEERGALSDYAAQIPMYVILDEDPGLRGALACLTTQP